MSLAPSSPRLPSPPPAAEIQIGSPSMADTAATRQAQAMEQTILDANAKRRIHPGTKAADMAAGPPIVPLNELDSAFQLQEHLAALHHHHTASNTQAMTRNTSLLLARAPPSTDRTLWLYELCRFLISQCNTLIVGFLFDEPPCSATTCPEMRASEWQFLCAVHEQPKSCCAIDYCCHTLDWAANIVTNPKLFPSRFVLHQDSHDKGAAVKALINVFRRLHRIFAHAWFQHRGVFWSVETQGGLYVLFKTVCDMYDLLPAENYKLPPEAEGLEGQAAASAAAAQREEEKKQQQQQISILPRLDPQRGDSGVQAPDDENYAHMNRNNTSRRHIRGSPSTGSAVTTVMEADEEDAAEVPGSRLKEVHISTPETVEEEPEVSEVPVIVEGNLVPGRKEARQEEDVKVAEYKRPAPESSDDEDDTADEDTVLEIKAEDDSASEEEKSSEDEDVTQAAKAMDAGALQGLSSTSVHDFANTNTPLSAEPSPNPTPRSSTNGLVKGEKEQAKSEDDEDEDEEEDDDDDDDSDTAPETKLSEKTGIKIVEGDKKQTAE